MFIDRREFYTNIYPFADENAEAKTLAWQPTIHVFDTKPMFERFGEVRWNGEFYTEQDIQQLTIAFAKAFELAKAAREKVSDQNSTR